jgi:hypothetical protein
MTFDDLESRGLLRTRPNPLTLEQVKRLRGVRPAGPPPRPSTEPIRVQTPRLEHRRGDGLRPDAESARHGYADQPLSTIRRGLSNRSDPRCVD